MSETVKKFVTSIRSLFAPSEREDPLHSMPDLEPEERDESVELTLADAVGLEPEPEVEA
jgi:hypothetical protein